MGNILEDRKQKEIEWSNFRRNIDPQKDPENYRRYRSNAKFYSVARRNLNFQYSWLRSRCENKKALVFGCGEGNEAFILAKANACEVVGIDISDVAIDKAQKEAQKKGVENKVKFMVMDAENLTFADNSFDIISVSGILHHLDLDKAYPELQRVLKQDGAVICSEPLAYNPLIQWYRRRTPHMRTEWEMQHILNLKSIRQAKKYFNHLEIRFFNLTTIFAVPFRKMPFFNIVLSLFEKIDALVLRIPLMQLLAWQVIFVLSDPKKR